MRASGGSCGRIQAHSTLYGVLERGPLSRPKERQLKSGRVLVLRVNRREAVKCAPNQLIWMAQAESRRRPIRE